VQGLLTRAYYNLALSENDRYENFKRLANRVYQNYQAKTGSFKGDQRIPLPPYNTLNRAVINGLLDPQKGMPYAARAVLRTQLGLPGETVSTNAPPAAPGTVENVPTNSAAK
jgi:hypothetical protein